MHDDVSPQDSPADPRQTAATGHQPDSTAPSGGATGDKPAAWWTSNAARSQTATPRLPQARLLWAVAVALTLVFTYLGTAPEETDVWRADLEVASSTARLNNDSASGAPQQTVVNGWHAIDLAEIQIEQAARLDERQRQIAALLLVMGLGFAGDLVIRSLQDRQDALRRRRKAEGFLNTGP